MNKFIINLFLIMGASIIVCAQNNCVDISINLIEDADCNSSTSYSGSASISVSNGSGNYSYIWQDINGVPLFPPQNSPVAQNLSPNDYIIEVTDLDNNCVENQIISIGYIGLIDSELTVSPFTIDPVFYNQWTIDTVKIYNNGCETRVRPEFRISHPTAYLNTNNFNIEYYDPLLTQWVLITTMNDNGEVIGYYGDSTGSILNQPVISKIVRVKFNPSAAMGVYTSENSLAEVDLNGNHIQQLDSLEYVSLELTDACPTFSNTANVVDASCYGYNGSIDLEVFGGSPPYNYQWSTGFITQDLNNMPADTYSVIIQDAGVCVLFDTLIISQPISGIPDNRFTENITSNSASLCFDVSTQIDQYRFRYREIGTNAWQVVGIGSLDQIAELDTIKFIYGLNSNRLYEWQMKAWSFNGCVDGWSDSEIFITSCVDINLSVIPISCYNQSDGEISAQITGTGSYSILWSTNDTALIISNLGPSLYTITVTDTSGCFEIDTINIVNPIPLQTGLPSSVFVCGEDTLLDAGSFNSTLWNTGESTQSILVDTTSLYIVQVIDANGCSLLDSVNVTIIDGRPSVTDLSLCLGDTVTIYAEGTGSYLNYWWPINLIADSIEISPTQSSSYQLIVNENNYSCYHTINVVVVDIPSLSLLSESVSCFGGSDGSAQVLASSGNPPYSYQWSNNSMFDSTNNLSSGYAQVEVRDSNNCSVIDSIFINEPLDFTISENLIDPLCFSYSDGSVQVSISGGTSPYSYLWSNGDTLSISDSLLAGPVWLQITDENNCIDVDTFELFNPAILSLSEDLLGHQDILCFGENTGSITLNANGGIPDYTFSTNGLNYQSSPVFNSLLADNYWFHVQDDNGCLDSLSINLNQPLSSVSAVELVNSHQDVTCYGYSNGQFEILPLGGSAPYYQIINQDTIFSSFSSMWDSLMVGTYNISIIDNYNCSYDTVIEIIEPSELIGNATSIDPSCFGLSDGLLIGQASGGTPNYTFYSNGMNADTISSLSSGLYQLIVMDANSCSDTILVSLDDPIELILTENTNIHEDVTCYGDLDGQFQLVAFGGTPNYQYQINGGSFQSSPFFDSLSAGLYNVTVFDINNCMDTVSITLLEPNAIILLEDINAHQDVTCFGGNDGSFDLSATGGTPGYSYILNNVLQNNGQYNNLSPGVYNIFVIDTNSCQSDSLSIIITEPLQNIILSEISSLHQDVLCFGDSTGSFTINASGGSLQYSYSINQLNWQNSPTFNNLFAGNYSVTVMDTNLCQEQITIDISEPNMLTANISVDPPNCYNGSDGTFSINAQGGTPLYSYFLNGLPSDSVIYNLNAGIFPFSVLDVNNCSFSDTAYIVEPPQIITVLDSIKDVTCYNFSDGLIDLEVLGGTPGYSYSIDGGPFFSSSLFTNLNQGVYDFTIIDSLLCTDSITITINQPDSLVLNIDSIINIDCFGGNNGSAFLETTGGTEPYLFLINGISQSSPNLTALSSQFYSVIATDSNNCIAIDTFSVFQPDSIIIQFNSIDVSCYGVRDGELSIQVISGSFPPYLYSIDDSAYVYNSVFSDLPAGIDTFWVQDSLGCQQNYIYEIEQPDSLQIYVTASEPTCYGSCDGLVEAIVLGSNSYSIIWSNFETSLINDSLCDGLISLTVLDSLGCSNYYSYDLQQPSPVFPIILNINGELQTMNNYVTYQWFDNNGPIIGANSFNFSPSQGGLYWVEVSDSSGCTGTSLEYNFSINTIDPNFNEINIFPNPVIDHIKIESSLNGDVLLFNHLGELIYRSLFENVLEINFSDFLSGIYILKIEASDQVVVRKIIKP